MADQGRGKEGLRRSQGELALGFIKGKHIKVTSEGGRGGEWMELLSSRDRGGAGRLVGAKSLTRLSPA